MLDRSPSNRAGILLAALLSITTIPSVANATYSVVATDSANAYVGGAGTSCVGALDVTIILGVAPGNGAVHAQAQINTAGRDQAVALLMQGETPADIIAAITAQSFDFIASSRQYGVVDLNGQAAGFTGNTNGVYAEDRQGTDGPYTYSVQGNILTSGLVIDNTEDGFVNGGGCDMADKLILALEAGAKNGEGDNRCTPDGIPADSAFIRIVDDSGTPVIALTVTDTAPTNPMVELRALYDDWRAQNPCADGGTGGSTGGTGGGSGGASSSGGSTATAGTSSGGGSSGGSGGSGGDASGSGDSGVSTSDATGGLSAGSASGTDSGGAEGGDGTKAGCGCVAGAGPTRLVLLLPLLLVRRRRAR